MKSILDDSRKRWYLLAILWGAMLLIGISGFVKQSQADGVDRDNLENLYLTLQLATLDYKGSSGPMNWQLQLSRFVVPILAASTLLQTASVVFRDEFRRYRLRYAKGHTIICGLSETGSRLASAFAEAGEDVVVIEPDEKVAAASGVAEQVRFVLPGSGADAAMLRTAGIDRASRLVVCTGTDATNVQVTQAAAMQTAGRSKPLRCSVQLDASELSTLLRAADLQSQGGTRISYFNLHERAARALVSELGPTFSPDEPAPHLMVLGLGQFGSGVVLALCQHWAEVNPDRKLTPTIVDRSARGRWEALRLQHPALTGSCEPTLVDLDLDRPEPEAIGDLIDLLTEDPPTWVAVAFDDESTALANAGFLHQHLSSSDVPIVVRMRTERGLGGLLRPHPEAGPALPGVVLFPFLDRTCTIATVDGGVREQLAEAVHEDYLVQAGIEGTGSPELLRPWSELDDAQRELSRRRVDGIITDLDALGYDLVPLRRWGAPQVRLREDEVERLAALDHKRWFDDRTAAGWTYGAIRDDARKENPLLVPWAELPASSRNANLSSAAGLLPMLARNGFEAATR